MPAAGCCCGTIAGEPADSGASLLIEKGGKWYTAGVDVAAELGVASGLAAVLDEARGALEIDAWSKSPGSD